jgi:zinc protease
VSARRIAVLFGLLAMLPAQTPPEQRLDNGLRVVLVERPELPLVTFALYLRGGLLADGPSTFRHASLAMGCLWMGCTSPTLGELDEEAMRAALADIGGESGSAVDLQDTRVQLSCLAPHAARGLDLLTAALFAPNYPDAVVAREVEQERNLLVRRSKQPEFLAQRALLQALCGEHPLSDAFALEDREGALAKLDRVALRAEHRRLVRPRLGTLFVVGPLSAELRETVLRRFASWPDTGDAPLAEPRPITPATGHRVIEVPRAEMTQVYVQMATLGPAPSDPQFAATHMFRMALSGGYTSRMQDELRVNRGLVYGITFTQPSLSIAAPTSITTSTRPDKVCRAARPNGRHPAPDARRRPARADAGGRPQSVARQPRDRTRVAHRLHRRDAPRPAPVRRARRLRARDRGGTHGNRRRRARRRPVVRARELHRRAGRRT